MNNRWNVLSESLNRPLRCGASPVPQRTFPRKSEASIQRGSEFASAARRMAKEEMRERNGRSGHDVSCLYQRERPNGPARRLRDVGGESERFVAIVIALADDLAVLEFEEGSKVSAQLAADGDALKGHG